MSADDMLITIKIPKNGPLELQGPDGMPPVIMLGYLSLAHGLVLQSIVAPAPVLTPPLSPIPPKKRLVGQG